MAKMKWVQIFAIHAKYLQLKVTVSISRHISKNRIWAGSTKRTVTLKIVFAPRLHFELGTNSSVFKERQIICQIKNKYCQVVDAHVGCR